MPNEFISNRRALAVLSALTVLGIAVAIGVYSATVHSNTDTKGGSSSDSALTPAQLSLARTAAIAEAAGTIPASAGGPPKPRPTLAANTFPDNVRSVSASLMTGTDAETFIGMGAEATLSQVLVVHLVGTFSVLNGGPIGSRGYSTGNSETILIDPQSGNFLEFDLTTEGNPVRPMPNGVDVYRQAAAD